MISDMSMCAFIDRNISNDIEAYIHYQQVRQIVRAWDLTANVCKQYNTG